MSKCKAVYSTCRSLQIKSAQCPTSEKEKEEMKKVPYNSAVGSLMYDMVCTRPDIAHAVGVVSQFQSNPGKDHWEAVKWILRYLRGSSRVCLSFGDCQTVLDGYTDADMAGHIDSRKSTSGYLMIFAGGAVSWQSKLKKCMALSTTETEYIAVTEACKEMLWLKKFLHEQVHGGDEQDEQHDIEDDVEIIDEQILPVHVDRNPPPVPPPVAPIRKCNRNRQPSTRYGDDFVMFSDVGEPESFLEVMSLD